MYRAYNYVCVFTATTSYYICISQFPLQTSQESRIVDIYNAVFVLSRRISDLSYIMNRSNLSFQRRQSGITVSSREKKTAV